MVHIFHFLPTSLVFEIANPFSFRGYLMPSPVTKVAWFQLDVRTLEFFPPAESWLANHSAVTVVKSCILHGQWIRHDSSNCTNWTFQCTLCGPALKYSEIYIQYRRSTSFPGSFPWLGRGARPRAKEKTLGTRLIGGSSWGADDAVLRVLANVARVRFRPCGVIRLALFRGFSSGVSAFPLSTKKNSISKFQFDQPDRGCPWKPVKVDLASSLSILILIFIFFFFTKDCRV